MHVAHEESSQGSISAIIDQVSLLKLPTELILLLPTFLKADRDISSLSRTCSHLHLILNPWLYRHDSEYCQSSSLLWAASNGSDVTAQLSIQQGGNVGIKDCSGRTPLVLAAENGHLALVKLLLETKKVDIESKDTEGRNILFWAARNGHAEVVKLLVESESVDVSSIDKTGWNVLFWPAANGYEAIVKMLLDTGRVNVDYKDAEGRTPLYMAAARGHDKVVGLLVGQGRASLDSTDTQGRSLFYWAEVNGYKDVERVLLEAESQHRCNSFLSHGCI